MGGQAWKSTGSSCWATRPTIIVLPPFYLCFTLRLFHQPNTYEVHFQFLRDNLLETCRPVGDEQSNCPNLMPVSFYS